MQPIPYGGQMPQYGTQNIHDLCRRYQLFLMQFETNDGQMFDGIIDNVDDDGVDVLVPVGDYNDDNDDYNNDNNWNRQFFPGYGGYGFPPYGYSPYGFGYPRRFRRFRRRRYPFHVFRRIFFPFFFY